MMRECGAAKMIPVMNHRNILDRLPAALKYCREFLGKIEGPKLHSMGDSTTHPLKITHFGETAMNRSVDDEIQKQRQETAKAVVEQILLETPRQISMEMYARTVAFSAFAAGWNAKAKEVQEELNDQTDRNNSNAAG